MQNDSELTIFGTGEPTTVPLLHQFVVGKRLDADVVLQDPGIAPTHVVINPSSRGALLLVIDQENRVPVVVEGETVREPRRLRHGDVVRIGRVRIVYRAGAQEFTPTSIKNPFWNHDVQAEEGPSSSPLESQRFSWLATAAPSPEERVARTMYRLTSLSTTVSSEAELLEGALGLTLEGVEAQQGVIATLANHGVPVPIAVLGFSEEEAASLPFEYRFLKRALEEGLATTLRHEAPSLYVPIVSVGSAPEGVLCLRRSEPNAQPFTDVEAQLAASVGRQLAAAVERVRLLKQLRAGGLAHSRLQRRFQAALGAIAEGLLLVSAEGLLEALNATGADLLAACLGGRAEAGTRLSSDVPLGRLVESARGGASPREVLTTTAGQSLAVSAFRVEGLDAVVVVLRDITSERRQEEVHREEQQALRGEILRVSGREQQRIGQTLHDGLCQQLVGISLLARMLMIELEGTPAGSIATEIGNLLSKAAEDTRRLAKGLCPVALETSGLGSALEELASSFGKMYPGVNCTVERTGEVLGPRNAVASHLYHVAQEAVSNALKHAGPTQVTLRLDEPEGGIRLVVENDGESFSDPGDASSGMGLRTMRYRARMLGGEFTLQPRDGGGTRLTFCITPTERER